MSSYSLMVKPRQVIRTLVFALLLSLLSAASVSAAHAQGFTLTIATGLSPSSVDPGGSSIATINIAATGSFNSSVSFDTVPCTVTPVPATGTAPQCAVSPASATPPAQAFLTITTASDTQPGLYTITVTGVSGSLPSQSLTLTLNVVNETGNYTLSVSPTTATPSPVPAGSIATALVTVTPIGNYTGTVTLACLSITPIVVSAPYCTFTATSGSNTLPPGTVQVTGGTAATATLTITTLGPVPTTTLRRQRIFYALWFLVPGLAFLGWGATGARRKHALGALLLTVVAGSLLLMPACGSNVATNSPNGEITPKNTYTFTLTGADQNGAAPATTTPATVMLVVN